MSSHSLTAHLTVTPEVAQLTCLGLVWAEPVHAGPAPQGLRQEMEETRARLAEAHTGKPPSSIPELALARRLYHAFGVDPTRTRPSSEALLRRVMRGKPLPVISGPVDLCNLLSLQFLLPMGLYDAAAIQEEVTLRHGREGEWYQGIRKDEVHVEGRPVLVDGQGPFGNPTSDSLRTSVQPGTTSIWLVIFAPIGFEAAAMEGHVAAACAAMKRHLAPGGARVITRHLVLGGR
jgi:DNA/RNA-binding domain of Phe-tRNA-synthetase-like protein